MEETRTKEVLDFVLASYRAKMAIQNPSENCPFDFNQFNKTWSGKYEDLNVLKSTVHRDLQPLIDEGIFDSIIPYLSTSINKSSGAQKEQEKSEGKASPIMNPKEAIISAEITALSPRLSKLKKVAGKDDSDNNEGEDNLEIVIHVFDESKNVRQDFSCPQLILLEEMEYFSKVTVKGQKLKDMDISVHCDISVFDWLIRWIKGKAGDHQPKLEASNVIGLMVSADFLQMPTLTTECIRFTADNIVDVIYSSPNLGCLNEPLTYKLCGHFSNADVERRIWRVDKNDRITSRLYTQFIVMLNQSKPDSSRGHYASTYTLFKCLSCGRLLTNAVASSVPCHSKKLDCKGRIYAIHVKDNHWSLNSFVRDLKRDLKSWRRVYWRLWSIVHFLPCSSCQLLFQMKDFGFCRYHPKAPQLQVNVVRATGEIKERVLHDPSNDKRSPEREVCINPFRRARELEMLGIAKAVEDERENEILIDTINCGFGVYPCCRRPGYKYHPLPETNGCQFTDHSVERTDDDTAEAIIQIVEQFKDLIVVTPKSREMRRQSFQWGDITDLCPKKMISNVTSSFQLPQTSSTHPHHQHYITLRPLSVKTENSSSEQISNPPSPTEGAQGGEGLGGQKSRGESDVPQDSRHSCPRGQTMSDFWYWNNDFTTRYNQDMQRESEEKLMSDLELLLSQRVSIDGAAGGRTSAGSSLRTSYFNRRDMKCLGGSFLKLEEQLREEQKRNRSTGIQSSSGIKPTGSSSCMLPLPQNSNNCTK